MNTFESENENLKLDSGPDGEPVELTENRFHVREFGGFCGKSCCCILDRLQLFSVGCRVTIQQAVAVVQAASNECMDEGEK